MKRALGEAIDSPHSLRHTRISELADSGKPVASLALFAGHVTYCAKTGKERPNIETTIRYYISPSDEGLDACGEWIASEEETLAKKKAK